MATIIRRSTTLTVERSGYAACDLGCWFAVDGLWLPVECEEGSRREWATETATLSRPEETRSSSAGDPVRGHCCRSSSRGRARRRLGTTARRHVLSDRSGRVADCRSQPCERLWTAKLGHRRPPSEQPISTPQRSVASNTTRDRSIHILSAGVGKDNRLDGHRPSHPSGVRARAPVAERW